MPATTWKILNKSSPGTSTTFGADDWDMPGRYMNDVDLSATASSTIKTNTSFWDNRLRIWNPAKTFSYRIRGSALLANRDLTLPLLTANDEVAVLMAAQEVQNKTFNVNLNTLRNTSNTIGQLLVGDGTKYLPLAMSATGGHVLTVKNDLTGLEWAASAATTLDGLSDTVITTPASGQVLTYNGTNWVNSAGAAGAAIANRMYDFTIYTDGTNFYALNAAGTVVSGPTATPETVFTYVFNNIAEFQCAFVSAGVYQFTGAFTGLLIDQKRIAIDFAPNAIIRVQNGFTGSLIKFSPPSVGESLYMVRLRGGHFAEAGVPAKNWTAFHLHSPTTGMDGIHDVWIQQATIQNAGTGIKLDIDHADGWINGNWFLDLDIRTSKKAVVFEGVTPDNIVSHGFNYNHFNRIHAQCEPTDSLGGIMNVRGGHNYFTECDIWDIPTTFPEIEISVDAYYTVINGGILGWRTAVDSGFATIWANHPEREQAGPFGVGRKIGEVTGNTTTPGASMSTGLLGDLVNYTSTGVSQSAGMDNTSAYLQYQTGTTTNSIAGFRTTNAVCRADHYPAFIVRWQFSDAGQNSRGFMGFVSTGSALATGNSYLDTFVGFGVGLRASAALPPVEVYHNTGGGAGTMTIINTGVARDTNIHTARFIVQFPTRIRYRIDENAWATFTPSAGMGGVSLFNQVAASHATGTDINLKIRKYKVWAT
jgi:hypothetical protein